MEEVIEEPVLRTFADASVQTDKRQITDKQREALQRGRALYKERRDKYKQWEKWDKEREEVVPVPPPVVRQEIEERPVRIMGFV